MLPSSHARSATVSLVALLMVGVYRVSGSAQHVRLHLRVTGQTQGENWYTCPYVSNFIPIHPCRACYLISFMVQFALSTALIYSGNCKD